MTSRLVRNISTTSTCSACSDIDSIHNFECDNKTDIDFSSDIDSSYSAQSTPQSTPKPPSSSITTRMASMASIKTENEYEYHHEYNTLVIFDWDDTLHPTSASQSGSKLDIELVRKFCLSVYETLLTMIRLYGAENIYIVSNADKLWIEKCLNKLSGGYFVNIYHLISLYEIQIISAKNEFSWKFPKDSTKWKQLTFEQLVKKHYNKNKQFAVVSIGDSQHEYIASKRVIKRLNININKNNEENKKIILHRIKLLQNPTLKQLIEQYSLIKKIAYLFKSETNQIDIDYHREMKYYKQHSNI